MKIKIADKMVILKIRKRIIVINHKHSNLINVDTE